MSFWNARSCCTPSLKVGSILQTLKSAGSRCRRHCGVWDGASANAQSVKRQNAAATALLKILFFPLPQLRFFILRRIRCTREPSTKPQAQVIFQVPVPKTPPLRFILPRRIPILAPWVVVGGTGAANRWGLAIWCRPCTLAF